MDYTVLLYSLYVLIHLDYKNNFDLFIGIFIISNNNTLLKILILP